MLSGNENKKADELRVSWQVWKVVTVVPLGNSVGPLKTNQRRRKDKEGKERRTRRKKEKKRKEKRKEKKTRNENKKRNAY